MGQYKTTIPVGILGGGQLARMLAFSAYNLGLEPHILSEKQDDPGAQVCRHWHQGRLDDSKTVARFLKNVQVATFESEFMEPRVLEQATTRSGQILPTPKAMATLRDRATQKATFDKFLITTSPWVNCKSQREVKQAIEEIGLPLVFKKRLMGYDGYGTFVVKTKKQLENFMNNHFQLNTFIAEKFIPFKRECAIIIARSKDGSFSHLPLVESLQKDSRCFWVKGPIRSAKIIPLMSPLKKMLDHLKYVGVMGVEFFDGKGGLIVNEIAPRVHNTGHYSINTDGPSQFDLHWWALLGQKLPKHTVKHKGFAMVNLLSKGPKTKHFQTLEDTWLHWYGKKDHRPGRKMGHINAIGTSPDVALKKALKAEKGFRI